LYWSKPKIALLVNYLSSTYERQYVLHELAVSLLEFSNAEALDFYLPQLFQCLRTDTNNKVFRLFTRAVKKSRLLLHKVLWMARVEAIIDTNSKRKVPLPYPSDELPELARKLFAVIAGEMDDHEIEIYADETDFFQKITGISGTLKPKDQSKTEKKAIIQKYLEKYQKELEERDPRKPPIYMIANPVLKINRILTNSGLPMQSAERCPIMITFIVEYYEGPDRLKMMERCREIFSAYKQERSPEEIKIEFVDTERKDERSFLPINKGRSYNLPMSTTFNKKLDNGLHLLDVKINNKSAVIEPQQASDKVLGKVKELALGKILNGGEARLFEREKKFSCIFKAKDDVRQDTLSIQIIRVFQEIFRKFKLDLFLYPYSTVSNRTGEVFSLMNIRIMILEV